MIEISKAQARKINLFAQGLAKRNPFGKGQSGALKAIQELGYLQIDTISVVSRAHHHTLWARVPNYRAEHLFRLLNTDRTIFEYWAHAASFLPMESFRYSLPRKKYLREGGKHWWPDDPKTEAYVRDRIRAEGPLRSKDFEHRGSNSGWFDWKPTKKALDKLYMQGELMISARQGFQKVYDLTERVLPQGIDTTTPTETEFAEHLINLHLNAQGFTRDKEVGHLRKGKGHLIRETLHHLAEAKKMTSIKIKGNPHIWYTKQEYLELANKRYGSRQVKLLCPFDNLMIQRHRPLDLFGFDYKLECYVPEPRRVVGYYALPVLFGDRFVAQIDAKADRKRQVFEIRNFQIEDARERVIWQAKLEAELAVYAQFNGCEELDWGR
ncbi:MAG: crosslink repair DNA glycosylase YcaQ family protein [Bacteroidota bacterium]